MSEEKLEALEQMILDRFENMEKTLQIILSKIEARDGGSGPPAIPNPTIGRLQTVSTLSYSPLTLNSLFNITGRYRLVEQTTTAT